MSALDINSPKVGFRKEESDQIDNKSLRDSSSHNPESHTSQAGYEKARI
jgi:hypothetical protein